MVSADVGVPNLARTSFSEPTVVISSTGPQRKLPTKPPIDVETAGARVVLSISAMLTPGETRFKGIYFFPLWLE